MAAAPVAPPLVTPNFLSIYGTKEVFYDYRPAVNAAGTEVVFERQFYKNTGNNTYVLEPEINLYTVGITFPSGIPPQPTASALPVRLLPTLDGSTRPDWCWREAQNDDGLIAFTSASGTYTLDTTNQKYKYVPNTGSTIYPAWYPGCQALAVYSEYALPHGADPVSSASANNPGPSTLKIDAVSGRFLKLLSGKSIWAGFMSVNRRNPSLVAIAGQPFYRPGTYNPPPGSNAPACTFAQSGYNQQCNYVFIADTSSSPPRVKPLDPDASMNRYDPIYQGRAPSWSPDGRWIAFESDRNCTQVINNITYDYYAIFIQDGRGRSNARQVTECGYDAQHAKWFKDPVNGRTLLIATLRRFPADTDPSNDATFTARGIATLDVTDFVQPTQGE